MIACLFQFGRAILFPFLNPSMLTLVWLIRSTSHSQTDKSMLTLVQLVQSCGFKTFSCSTQMSIKGVHALRGYFGPPMRQKNEIRFSPNSSYWFIRTMAQVYYKSDISLTFTLAMVTKMAAKTG